MQIKISSVEIKKTVKGVEYKVVKADNFSSSAWIDAPGYEFLVAGNTVNVDTKESQKDGKTYQNITKTEFVKAEPLPTPAQANYEDKQLSIEIQNCFTNICNLWIGGMPPPESVQAWVWRRIAHYTDTQVEAPSVTPSEPTEVQESVTVNFSSYQSFIDEVQKRLDRLGWDNEKMAKYLNEHVKEYTTVNLKKMSIADKKWLVEHLDKVT